MPRRHDWRRTARAALLALLPAGGLAACGGGGTGPADAIPASVTGEWVAGPSCKAAGCAVVATLRGAPGALPLTDSLELDLSLRSSGSVTSTLRYGDRPAHTLLGSARSQGNGLIIDYSSAPSDTITYALLPGPLLRFDFRNLLLLDVTGDAVPDSLQIYVVFARH